MARFNGVLLFVITGCVSFKNVVTFRKDIVKSFPYIMCLIVSFGFCLAPLLLIIKVDPFDMYCRSKIDTKFEVPDWCMTALPNLYAHVQKLYWNAGFLEFLNRPNWIVEFLKALPTNVFSIYAILKVISHNGLLHFITLGAFKPDAKPEKEGEEVTFDVEESPFAIALGWHYLLSFLMVFLGANQEINTRVLSISPLYILIMLNLLMAKDLTKFEILLGKTVAGYNLFQLVFNMVAFPL